PAQINRRIYGYIQTKDATTVAKIFLFPMNSWHLYNHFENGKSAGGQIKYVRLFTLIGWIILIIACINFMNLATARSEHRAREVGIRKTLGSGRGKLVRQFISEAMVMSLLSTAVAILIVILVLPAFNQLTGRTLEFRLFYLPHLAGLVAIALVCGLAAGSYPAFYLSSFRPVKVLKGVRLSPKAGLIRKGLVITQFCVSTILIICTIIIFQQIRHGKDRDLGLDRQNLIDVPLRGDMSSHFELLHQSLVSTGLVKDAALGANEVFSLGSNGGGFSWPGKDPSKDVLITQEQVSPGYVKTLGMHLASGREFYPDAQTDSNDIIINESLAHLMGKEGVVGHYLIRSSQRWRIIGILRDFVYNNMYQSARPLLLYCYPSLTNWLFVRFMPGIDPERGIAAVRKVVRSEQPAYPFEYNFVDHQFDELFKSETLIGNLAAVFASLAVCISCLGLLGLAAFSAERRTREIGIRRVLGASLSGLMGLLSSEFLKLVAMACLAALPFSWWIMHNWLQSYEYRIKIQWWVFGATIIGALGITLLTVSIQAWRAAAMSPSKSLRTE
ncbi:MAG TPA: FtsX-like permease family protein, partial [Chitinophagaceae bacterium]|nr:FtsX-like permease family protein [Chitinophagaceae bacterium]